MILPEVRALEFAVLDKLPTLLKKDVNEKIIIAILSHCMTVNFEMMKRQCDHFLRAKPPKEVDLCSFYLPTIVVKRSWQDYHFDI